MHQEITKGPNAKYFLSLPHGSVPMPLVTVQFILIYSDVNGTGIQFHSLLDPQGV
jgi:hypothetical protein